MFDNTVKMKVIWSWYIHVIHVCILKILYLFLAVFSLINCQFYVAMCVLFISYVCAFILCSSRFKSCTCSHVEL